MNPEDRMKLLRDPDQWNVRLTARTGVFAARRISPLFVSIATVATVAIVGVILFAVFGASIRAIRDPNLQPASPSPTAEAVQRPEQVFGGDCANVFTDDQLASFGDSPFAADDNGTQATTYGNDDDFTFIVEQVGGIDCSWTGNDGWIRVALFPAAVAPEIEDTTCGPGYGEGTAGPNFCGIQHETNGIRITGGISGTDAATAAAVSPKIVAAFEVAAASVSAPVNAAVPGAWTNPVDCPALDASIDASTLFGAGVEYRPDTGGSEGIYIPLKGYINDLMFVSCYWAAENGTSVTVQVHGGGAWNAADIAKLDTVTPVNVPNIDAAYIETGGPNGPLLHIFDGPNWLIMSTSPNESASLESAAVTLVDALNAAETPDAAASGTEHPDPKTTDTGLGDLVIGQRVPSNTTLVEWDADVCGGRWVPTGEVGQDVFYNFIVKTADNTKLGAIERITILASDISTPAGIHPGSTLAELEGGYADFDEIDTAQSDIVDLYVLENDLAQTVIQVDKASEQVSFIKIEDARLLAHPVPLDSCAN